MKFTIKEKNDEIKIICDSKELKSLPMKSVMKTLEVLRSLNHFPGFYFEFDDKTQKYIDDNFQLYKDLCLQENQSFKEFSSIIFKEINTPVYQYSDIFTMIDNVYQKEHFFDNIKMIKEPQVTYKIHHEENSIHDKVISVKNLDELISEHGKAKTLHSLILFKDFLNKDYQIRTKSKNEPFGISSQIKMASFNEETQTHEILPSFNDKNYFFTSALHQQAKSISYPGKIFQLVDLQEQLRLAIDKPTKKIKP